MRGRGLPAKEWSILVTCLAVFGLMTGQQMVTPILAPLARQLGFSELMLGIVMTVGASGVALASPFWGRRAMVWGQRVVLLISLGGAAVGLLAFAIVARIGLTGVLGVPVLFTLVLLSRGLVFGLAWAAGPVAAQSHVADMTSGEAARMRGMSMLGAAQGLGMAVGPAIGGVLVVAGLLIPVYIAPIILATIALLAWIGLPRPQAHRPRSVPVKVRPLDRRMWPFLTAGFGMYLAFGLVLMTVGFLLQDRLDLTPADTGRATGLVMFLGAGMMVLVQTVIVRRLSWTPAHLIRVGTTVMTGGMAIMAIAGSGLLIATGIGLLGIGMGLGLPGYMSAPTLLATKEEQGAVAGLVGSTNALTFMLGPIVGTGLYQIAPVAPFAFGTALLACIAAFVFIHPAIRQTSPRIVDDAEVNEPTNTRQ